MTPCPACRGRGLTDCPEQWRVECGACGGDGIDKSTRRNRLKYAMELLDPFRQPGYGITGGDVWDCMQ